MCGKRTNNFPWKILIRQSPWRHQTFASNPLPVLSSSQNVFCIPRKVTE